MCDMDRVPMMSVVIALMYDVGYIQIVEPVFDENDKKGYEIVQKIVEG